MCVSIHSNSINFHYLAWSLKRRYIDSLLPAPGAPNCNVHCEVEVLIKRPNSHRISSLEFKVYLPINCKLNTVLFSVDFESVPLRFYFGNATSFLSPNHAIVCFCVNCTEESIVLMAHGFHNIHLTIIWPTAIYFILGKLKRREFNEKLRLNKQVGSSKF